MKSFTLLSLALGIFIASPLALAERGGKPKQVLFFTKSSGYEHSVIKTQDGQPSLAHKALEELGAKHGFVVTHTKDGGVFTPEGIAKYDAFLLHDGRSHHAGKRQEPAHVGRGQGRVPGGHCQGQGLRRHARGADTFHSPGERFEASGEAAVYVKMLGGEFIKHGQQQKAKVVCADARFPGFAECKDSFEMLEEWYSFKNFARIYTCCTGWGPGA